MSAQQQPPTKLEKQTTEFMHQNSVSAQNQGAEQDPIKMEKLFSQQLAGSKILSQQQSSISEPKMEKLNSESQHGSLINDNNTSQTIKLESLYSQSQQLSQQQKQ